MVLLFKSRRALCPQARDFLLATLKSHLIIRISQGQAVDGNLRHMEEMRKIGDVRVSKQEQHESLQIDVLKEAGCENSLR